jgi:hypothetical protein
MAPFTRDAHLDDILVSHLVKRSSGPMLKHKLMQLSLYTYLEKKLGVEQVEMEHPLVYAGSAKEHKDYDKKLRKEVTTWKGDKPDWPVDIALRYQDGNKKVCELIEVETINLTEFWERFTSMRNKINKVKKICGKNRDLNPILADADEIRFSFSLNASGLDTETTDKLIEEFVENMGHIDRDNGIRPYKLYILRENLYDLCPPGMNTKILDSVDGAYTRGTRWKPAFKDALASSYQQIRKLEPEKLERLYVVRRLNKLLSDSQTSA